MPRWEVIIINYISGRNHGDKERLPEELISFCRIIGIGIKRCSRGIDFLRLPARREEGFCFEFRYADKMRGILGEDASREANLSAAGTLGREILVVFVVVAHTLGGGEGRSEDLLGTGIDNGKLRKTNASEKKD